MFYGYWTKLAFYNFEHFTYGQTKLVSDVDVIEYLRSKNVLSCRRNKSDEVKGIKMFYVKC
jgi:hypothetical protein